MSVCLPCAKEIIDSRTFGNVMAMTAMIDHLVSACDKGKITVQKRDQYLQQMIDAETTFNAVVEPLLTDISNNIG